MPEAGGPVDPSHYRTVLGHFATGVTVVTASDGGQPVGMAVNSFTSVSLDPPLVMFCAARSSTTWPVIKAAGAFAVNVLAADQEELSRAFATKDADRFSCVDHRPGITGSPILVGALAYIDCTLDALHDAGDHELVVGRVVDLDVQRDADPLVFFRGDYGYLA